MNRITLYPGAVLRGYFEGKRHAEKVLLQSFPETGVALRPGFIHGTRNVGGVGIPLGLVGRADDCLDWPSEGLLRLASATSS